MKKYFFPKILPALVAPKFFEPYSLKSIPLTAFPIIKAVGNEPNK